MRTIPRNHTARIAALRQSLTACAVHSEATYFAAAEVDPAQAWRELDRSPRARLIDRGDGQYTVRIHSNLWFELREA